ncbi:carbohydrate sulfotransferase 3-like [Lytechinus variegatus]|uniref:carbohydrate sulfotransferase 3-like n=1 Tax=Lytechinus variegatus TaxID=7654 RepID=UPI001BB11EAF|nr:carbohydrate sulfotransferase 3-like [Lytechinus variegatus]
MDWKLTSQTICWVCSLALLFVFLSLYASLNDWDSFKPEPFFLEQSFSNMSYVSGEIYRQRDKLTMSSESGGADVDVELSSFTEEGSNKTLDEMLIQSVDDDEDEPAAPRESLNTSTEDMMSLNETVPPKYDPQVFVDLYKNRTITDLGKTNPPPVIIIMAQWRFGSSVFGELFNQNSDLFYLFEPLFATKELRKIKDIGLYTPESEQLSRSILRKMSKCNFDPGFVSALDHWNGKTKNKAICKASQNCKIISPSWMSSLCHKYKGQIATKLIRVNLELLRPLVVDDHINLKIVHLVRDPRGSGLSRIKYRLSDMKIAPTVRSQFPQTGRLKPLELLSVTPETSQTIRGMCTWIRNNAIVSPNRLPAWLHGRYYLVRYEDFADTPLKITRDLYKFVGIPLKKEVSEWVIKNTHVDDKTKLHGLNNKFSTHRDSHVAATHWIKDLTKLEVKQIEEECMDVLELMGYQPYNKIMREI